MLSLVWFKRDLRVQDHPALALAAAQGRVLPVHIVEPELWAQPDASARHWAFLGECIDGLRHDLAQLGQPLIVRSGDAVEVLARLHKRYRFSQIVSHLEHGTPWTRARNDRVAAWAGHAGLRWTVVARDDGGAAPLPVSLPRVADGTGTLPDARALGLADDPCPNRQPGGREAALRTLDSFLTVRGRAYRVALSAPLEAERASSRLSAHLSFGTLSIREVAQAVTDARCERRGQKTWPASLRSFDTRLKTREQTLRVFDETNLIEAADAPDTDPLLLHSWSKGETGLPFADACMRALTATGWLPHPFRAMLMTLAGHQMGLDWRQATLHLARRFTDYEPGILWGNARRLAGLGAGPAPRIVNPVTLGHRHDPHGRFIRRWLPELAPVPDPFLHEPWKWPGAQRFLGRRYPEPVIAPASATGAAREALLARRRALGLAGRAARRTVPSPSAQLALPL